MAETQDATLNDVKTIGECNQSMMESMMTILQSIQIQNLKIEQRVGGLESEVRSLRSDMTKMKVNTEQHATELSNVKDIVEKVLPQKVKDIMKEELKGQLPKVKKRDEAEGAEPSRYSVKRQFNSDLNYGIYVKQHVREGMKVRYCSGDGYLWLAMGDVGTVRGLTNNMVSVDWSGHFFPKNKNVCFYDVELLG